MFRLLVKIGYKEIEIGFPAASQTDFDFVRKLIERGPDPRRRHRAGADAGARAADRAHVRGAAGREARDRAPLQLDVDHAAARRVRPRPRGHRQIAVDGGEGRSATARATQPETEWTFQYSPESFTGTELDFAKEVCDAVLDVWQPTPQRKVIINLPATVEMATPNVYADQIEWMSPQPRAPRQRSCCRCIRTTTAAAASRRPSSALMAGADRIEGCLFGNGERTGNVCLVTLGLNLLHAGHRPGHRLLRHQRDHPHGRVLQPAAGASAPSVRRRPRVHRVLRLAPGRDQEGPRRARDGTGARQRGVGRAVPADRPGRPRPHLRRGDPRQQPVGQGRHRLPARARLRARAAAPAADRVRAGDPAHHRRDRQGAVVGRDPRGVRARVPRGDDAGRLRRPSRAAQRRRRHGRAADRAPARSTASRRC